MPIQYTNDKQQLYTLYQKPNKRGTLRYYFSQKPSAGAIPVETLPPGYEIYENVNGQVFLRKHKPALITAAERQLTESILQQVGHIKYYKIDIKGTLLGIYTPAADVDRLVGLMTTINPYAEVESVILRNTQWEETMRFELIDADTRIFQALRYCYLGGIDDWIEIGAPAELAQVLQEFVPHIGQESDYELL